MHSSECLIVAFVTGANRGIGLEAGLRVLPRQLGGVADPSSITRLATEVEQEFGR